MNLNENSGADLRRTKQRTYLLALASLVLIATINYFWFQMSLAESVPYFFLGSIFVVLLIEFGFRQAERMARRLRQEIETKSQVEDQLHLQSTALAAAANAVVMTDRDGQILWVNPAFTHLTGYTAAEAIGNNPRLLRSGVHDEPFFATLWQTVLSGQVWQGETTNRRKDGTLYVEEQTITPVIDRTGHVTHFISIKQDITERKEAYTAERNQRILAEVLRDANTSLSATLDLEDVLDKLLVLVARLVTYDAANLMLLDGGQARVSRSRGYEQMDALFAASVDQLNFEVARTPNLQEIVNTREPLIIPDVHGYPGWQSGRASGQMRSWMGIPIVRDEQVLAIFALEKTTADFYQPQDAARLVTFAAQAGLALQNTQLYAEAQRQARQLDAWNTELEERVNSRTHELAAANERLQELDRLKSKFIADVSHELRTPVTNLSMYLDLLQRGKVERRQHYLKILQQETVRLRGLIEDILDLSRLELSTNSRERHKLLNLNDVVQTVYQSQQVFAAAAGIALEMILDPQLPSITGDGHQLAQAIHNLVKNAINYTTTGKVLLRTCHANGQVCVQVEDSGMGIDLEDMPHIFERFYRGDRASQSTIPGTGLGLGIVQEIMQLHAGVVTVDSSVGEGSVFELQFPIPA